jgi:hypothetical protein
MALMPAPVVPAPEARGIRYGLLAAANGPIDLPEHGRAAGVQYEPVTCGFARLYPVECPPEVTPTEKVFDPAEDVIEADPFVVYSTLQCGAAGHTSAELQTKVLRRLVNGEQSIAEEGVATILAAGATPLAADDETSFRSALGELEQWLYGDGGQYGNVGYLHTPVRFAAYAAAAGALIKDGPLWRTHMGSIWVFGGGYPDDGKIYISGQVTVWRTPEPFVAPPEQTFDRAANQYMLLAEREYAVAYDCVAASVEFVPEVVAS